MAIAVVVVWGLTYILTKVLIQQGLHPHEIFFYRFLVAYAGIWLIAPRRLLANSWKEEGLLALAGFFGGSLYFYTENTALGLTQASNVAFLLCTAPLLTAFLSAAFYKEDRLTRRLLMGSMLALCGVGLIVFGGKEGLKVSPAGDLLTLCRSEERRVGKECRLSPGKCSFMGYLPFCRCLPYFLSGRIRSSCAGPKCGRTCCFWL